MADANLAVPKPESGDADDVVLGLETAATLWKRGDAQDAIRWVRRAAEAAEEAGNDMRALTLARAAADLTTAQETAPKPKPQAAAPAPAAKPAPAPEAKSSTPQPAAKPSTPRPVSTPFAASPKADSGPAASRRPPTPLSTPPGAKSSKPRNVSAIDALTELASLARADGSAVGRSKSTSPTALRGLRVALARSKEQPGMLLARVLSNDEIAERGEKNGMVIATEVIIEQLLKPR